MSGNSEYQILLRDQQGHIHKQITTYLAFTLDRSINAVGNLSITLPYRYLKISSLLPDMQMEVWRSADHSPFRLVGKTLFFLRKWEEVLQQDGTWDLVLTGVDALDLLTRHIVTYPAGSAQADKTGGADTIMLAYVNENGGSATVDTTRIWPKFRVAAPWGVSACPTVTKTATNRDLLTLCQEIAATSFVGGQYLAFDIVTSVPGDGTALEFQTFLNQRGVDHRVHPFHRGVGTTFTLTAEAGRLGELQRGWDWTDAETTVYAGSPGKRQSQLTALAHSDYENMSVYNRVEAYHPVPTTHDGNKATGGATPTTTITAQAQTDANTFIYTKRMKRTLSARVTESTGFKFQENFDYGDLMSVAAHGELWNVRLDAISIRVQDRNEEIVATLKADAPDDSLLLQV